MLKPTIQDALNDQIQAEFHSAYIYLAMSAHFEATSMPGCAAWMKQQAQEEAMHAMKLFDFVNDRGGRAVLKSIEQPQTEYGTPLEVFQATLKHEQYVSGRINDLYALAVKENDYPTQSHLQWFIDEQVEEEKTAGDIVDLFTRAADHAGALFMIDTQLGQRGAAGGGEAGGGV